MSILGSIASFLGFSGRGPTDRFWYTPVGRKTVSGENVSEDVAMTYSAVWAATRLLSATGACLPLNLMEGNRREKRIASDHPIHDLIHNEPNPEMGSMMWRSTKFKQQVNAGNAFSEIERVNGRAARLWPIHHSRVNPCRLDAKTAAIYGGMVGGLAWEIKTDDIGGEGRPQLILDKDMLHVPSMISDNGIIGKGVIAHARESIGFGIATEKQGAAYMKNSARPLIVIKGGEFESEDAREYYRNAWMDAHGGAENNGKPAMLPPGAEIDRLSFSPEDSQFLQTREHNVNEIARWYGVPPHMIQDLRRATFTNIEHQGIEFVVYSLIPWLKIWEEQMNRKLLTRAERGRFFIKHNVEGLLRGDSSSRADFYNSMFGIGALSVNDIRQLEDLNGIGPDGDKHFVPLNFTTIDKTGMVDDPEPAKMTAVESELLEALSATLQRPPTIIEKQQERLVDLTPHREAAEAVLVETVQRFLLKEQNSAKTASQKGGKFFMGWLDDFYEDRPAKMAAAFESPLRAVLAFDDREDAETVAEDVAKRLERESKDILLELAGGADESTLNAVVSGGVENWQERAQQVVKWLKN